MAPGWKEEDAEEAVQPHVVFFPLPVKGHLNPYLSIAHYLASNGVHVTFIHGPSSSSASFDQSGPSIRFEIMRELDALLPPAKPGGDTQADAEGRKPETEPKPPRDFLRDSTPPLRTSLEGLLRRLFLPDSKLRPPSCIFTEGFLPWTHDVALQFGLARVEIWTLSAAVFSIGLHFSEVPARGHALPVKLGSPEAEETVDFIPGLPPLCLKDLPFMLVRDSAEFREFILQAFERCKEADRVLVNTFYELEGEAIDVLRQAGVRIEAVGPLVATTSLPSRLTGTEEEEDAACLGWLHTRPERSVVYLSFGSLATLEAETVRELALGLEASGHAFLWVIRPGSLGGLPAAGALPEGFQERTRGRGLIVSWAPQLDVLGHPAVGAFVTHCGWNSTTEALDAGVPMIGLPLIAEQNTNLRFLADTWQAAARLTPDYHCPVTRDAVEERLRSVMTGSLGLRLRERTLALSQIARQSSVSRANLHGLVADLHSGKLGPTKTPVV